MARPAPPPIPLSNRHRILLERLLKRQKTQQRIVRRVRIILGCSRADIGSRQLAKELGTSQPTVDLWRARWLAAIPVLEAAEAAGETDKALLARIESLLQDEQRPGTPATFTEEEIVQIVALACEDPQKSGHPVSHWTGTLLAQEAIKRGIVETISQRSVDRFLKRSRPQTASKPLLARTAD